jgi:hypothetical protein
MATRRSRKVASTTCFGAEQTHTAAESGTTKTAYEAWFKPRDNYNLQIKKNTQGFKNALGFPGRKLEAFKKTGKLELCIRRGFHN